MINETKQRIEAYKAALPGIKERVVAVAVMLVLSITMMASASYAWVTLSRAPEVSLLSTTVAANGNLEIALVGKEGAEPSEVGIGDSSSTEGMSLVQANIAWGNLVNLSDSTYGLNQISLRPALLSGYNLNKTPLYGATYSEDGRVQDVSATYQYASWTEAEDGTWYFAAGEAAKYGVRAISSVKHENITGNAAISSLMTKARNAYTSTRNMYLNVINGTTMVDETRNISCMKALTMLLEIFVNEKGESATVSGGDVYYDYQSVVTYTYRLLLEYQKILDAEGEALVLLANLQAYAKNAELGTAHFKSAEELRKASASTLNSLGIKLESLASYKQNYTDLEYGIKGLQQYAIDYDPDTGTATEKVYWADRVPQLDENGNEMKDESGNKIFTTVDGIGKYVSKLVDINTTTANGYAMNQISISNALSVLKNPIKVVVKKGVLKDTEQRLGDMLKTENTTVSINISVMNLGKRDGVVSTDAAAPFLSNNDMGYSASQEATGDGDAISLDTYGFAVDLWVRTNAEDSVLILEGSTEYEEIDETTKDKNGNETVLYIASNSEENVSFEVYLLTEDDGTINVYNAFSHSVIGTQVEFLENGYSLVKQTKKVVMGYDGEYRVWQDLDQLLADELISEHSTTQGAGSCYVFYANPSDQTRILNMLEAFTIAFLDQEGNHIATAKLATDEAYAINGKVTVPLKVISGVTYIDEEGEEQLGIRPLPRNVATWLTAVVYLDGMMLTNEDVLAAGEIEGRLNIQFGSSNLMEPMDDLELQQKYRIVSAVATSGNQTSTKQDELIEFDYDGTAKQVTVTLSIEGDQPTNMSGFFIRAIGANGGTRTEEEVFQPNGDGTWSATFDLTKPGSYFLRSIIVDGAEYDLDEFPSVFIEGMSIGAITTDPGTGVVMTADNYVDVDVTVDINADAALMPKQVRAIFRENVDNNPREFTAVLSYDKNYGQWVGTARITGSGTYTLTYLVMDGEFTELDASKQSTLIVTLGMKASVQCTGITGADGKSVNDFEFVFDNGPYVLAMRAEIFDDAGNEIEGQENVTLYYWLDGGDTDQDGMNAVLTWDEATGYYVGNLEMEFAGTYYFDRIALVISGNTSNIRTATSSPTFVSQPPEPPAMGTDNVTPDYQFAPAGDASLSVNMRYAQTAEMWALIENIVTGQKQIVRSDKKISATDPTIAGGADYYTFYFPVPANNVNTAGIYPGGNYQGNQDGEWVIKEVWLQKVFDEDLNFYGSKVDETTGLPAAEDCMVFDVYDESKSAQDNIYSYVVHTVRVDVIKGSDTKYDGDVYGKDASGNPSAVFMQNHAVSGVKLEIYDWKKLPVQNLENVKLKVKHSADSLAKGGYTSTTYLYPETEWALTQSGISYAAADLNLSLAGTYKVDFSYEINRTEYTDKEMMIFEVWSKAPTVSITARTSYGSSSHTATSATVYFNESKSTTCGITSTNYSQPYVTITLAGYGNASGATLTFEKSGGGDVHLYPGNGDIASRKTSAYVWSGDGTCQRWVGYYQSATGNDTKTPAGTLVAKTLVFTYGGNSFEFDIPDITINNPN